ALAEVAHTSDIAPDLDAVQDDIGVSDVDAAAQPRLRVQRAGEPAGDAELLEPHPGRPQDPHRRPGVLAVQQRRRPAGAEIGQRVAAADRRGTIDRRRAAVAPAGHTNLAAHDTGSAAAERASVCESRTSHDRKTLITVLRIHRINSSLAYHASAPGWINFR